MVGDFALRFGRAGPLRHRSSLTRTRCLKVHFPFSAHLRREILQSNEDTIIYSNSI
jgi:hypothetical protein